MSLDSYGSVILKPVLESKAREALIVFLTKSFNGGTREEIESLVDSAPLLLVKKISSTRGKKLVEKIKATGANATFVKHADADDTMSSMRKSTMTLASDLADTTVQPVEAPAMSGTKRMFIAVAVLLVGLVAGFVMRNVIFPEDGVDVQISTPLSAENVKSFESTQSGAMETESSATKPEPPGTELFDDRIANGLIEAVALYARLFGDDNAIPVKLSSHSIQKDSTSYDVRYNASVGEKELSYSVEVPMQPDDVEGALAAIRATLLRIISDFSDELPPVGSIKIARSIPLADLAVKVRSYDYLDMFDALHTIGSATSRNGADPNALYMASNTLSLLAFFKAEHNSQDISDFLAKHAVGMFLVASLLDSSKGGEASSAHAGKLLSGLGYNPAARHAFENATGLDQTGKYLKLFMAKDVNSLQKELFSQNADRRLASYLLARSYYDLSQKSESWKEIVAGLKSYPQFILLREYALLSNKTGTGKDYLDQYLDDVMEKHLYLIKEIFETGWISSDTELQTRIREVVSREQAREKWFSIHGKIVANSTMPAISVKLLDIDAIKHLLKHDMRNAFYINYDVEAGVDYDGSRMANSIGGNTAHKSSVLNGS